MRRDLFEEFCREYVRELNRLRMEHRASVSQRKTGTCCRMRDPQADSGDQGWSIGDVHQGRAALARSEEGRAAIAARSAGDAGTAAPSNGRRLSREGRRPVPGAENEESRTAPSNAIRDLIEAILLEPDGEQLKITLKGDLAGMLSAARDSKRSPETGDLLVQIQLVAGARNRQYRPRCTSSRHEPVQHVVSHAFHVG